MWTYFAAAAILARAAVALVGLSFTVFSEEPGLAGAGVASLTCVGASGFILARFVVGAVIQVWNDKTKEENDEMKVTVFTCLIVHYRVKKTAASKLHETWETAKCAHVPGWKTKAFFVTTVNVLNGKWPERTSTLSSPVCTDPSTYTVNQKHLCNSCKN